MGTHPISESDFDCLTETFIEREMSEKSEMNEIRNHFCEGEIEAFKICNDIGQRNYRNSQTIKKEETYEPLECTVFLENQNRFFNFGAMWLRDIHRKEFLKIGVVILIKMQKILLKQ